MLTSLAKHRLVIAGLAALAVVVAYGLSDPGGSQAQTPPDATATYVALVNQLQQQLQQQQQQLSQQASQATLTPQQMLLQQTAPTATPTLVPILNVTPVANAVATSATATAPSGVTTPVAAVPIAAAAPQAQDACALQLASVSGGQTIEFQDVDVSLPASGSFVYGFVRPESGATPQVVICNTQTVSTIYINAQTGREMARRANGDSGATSLNQIMAGVRTRGALSAAGTSTAITPPNTGDAGLR